MFIVKSECSNILAENISFSQKQLPRKSAWKSPWRSFARTCHEIYEYPEQANYDESGVLNLEQCSQKSQARLVMAKIGLSDSDLLGYLCKMTLNILGVRMSRSTESLKPRGWFLIGKMLKLYSILARNGFFNNGQVSLKTFQWAAQLVAYSTLKYSSQDSSWQPMKPQGNQGLARTPARLPMLIAQKPAAQQPQNSAKPDKRLYFLLCSGGRAAELIHRAKALKKTVTNFDTRLNGRTSEVQSVQSSVLLCTGYRQDYPLRSHWLPRQKTNQQNIQNRVPLGAHLP